MNILGKQFINGMRTAGSETTFVSYDAVSGAELPYSFFHATDAEIRSAAEAAARAYPVYRNTGLEQRAGFLEAIAGELDSLDDSFVQTVMTETGLLEARVRGERLRTSNQLRLFATVVRRGNFLGARIDSALPERTPSPRPDIRQYRIGTGPIAVFGAGNFPLAFSVAGGDTASALAAGCPVIVKAHSGHPVTSELVGQAVVRAVERCRIPSGVFGMLFGDNSGEPLVTAHEIKAVAFTGSLRGGRALSEIAARRPEPIPVFAEMSSINPVIILPGALKERSSEIAAGLAGSVTLGGGQFCTKPGLIIGIAGEPFDRFCRQLTVEITKRDSAVMLNRTILKNYQEGITRMSQIPGVKLLASGRSDTDQARTYVFRADATLLHHAGHPLEEEVFGPSTVVVAVTDMQELLDLAPRLNGHLTAGIFAESADAEWCGPLSAALETRVGRIILNDYPTGVEVCDAMVHGGPYPASSDSRFTSVGSLSIDRFLRPVCYQGYPDHLLPPVLQDHNPLGIRRLVNGRWTSEKSLSLTAAHCSP
jgi:NADP-dependent aldehyde dehydrogenase